MSLRISRRDFLQSASIAVCNSALNLTDAQESKYVTAETVFGKVRGVEGKGGVKIFKGVPYGADTGGANRFMAPVDPMNWSGVRDALQYGHSAPQSVPPARTGLSSTPSIPKPESGPSIFKALGVPGDKPTGEGEDCLVLNVWTPAIKDGRKRPVMLWLHGGGFRGGSGSNPGWDGTNLCLRGDVVVVTINHRLNVMGFANFSGISNDFAASGEAGMLDIVHALKWVRTNIEQFGGDPNTVMIFGQSGGGRKCETLLAMPSAKGLFHRAAIESGIAIKVVDLDMAHRNAEMLLAKLGISKGDVRKVQTVPLEQIMRAHFEINRELGNDDLDTKGFAPSVDGTILPQHPFYPAASRISADVPVLIGSTRTEFTGLTTDAHLFNLNEDGMRTEVGKLLGDKAPAVVALYRKQNSNATPSDLFFLIASDYGYGAKTWKVAERRAALRSAPVFLYYFAWMSPVQGGQLRSPHNIEWPFAFDNARICANLTGGGPEAIALADKVSDAWIAFARTGNPNTPKLPHWPAFDETSRATMIFDNISKVANDPFRDQRIAMFQALNLT